MFSLKKFGKMRARYTTTSMRWVQILNFSHSKVGIVIIGVNNSSRDIHSSTGPWYHIDYSLWACEIIVNIKILKCTLTSAHRQCDTLTMVLREIARLLHYHSCNFFYRVSTTAIFIYTSNYIAYRFKFFTEPNKK